MTFMGPLAVSIGAGQALTLIQSRVKTQETLFLIRNLRSNHCGASRESAAAQLELMMRPN